jgi:carbon-monoxide dehydrogenase small subunit
MGTDAATHEFELTVNGHRIKARAEPRMHLADFLREQLDLTGTHLGCEHGVCGACTVLLEGEPARACLTFAIACAGSTVDTIESMDDDPVMSELRVAFTREHALQCGYCTPGMLITARDLVLRLPDADQHRIRLGLAGNLCRCTGYAGIVRAVRAVISARRTQGIAPLSCAARRLGPVGAAAMPADVMPRAQRAERERATTPAPTPVPPNGFKPAHGFARSFTVSYPPDAVFALFGRVEDVARCLPGASITGRPNADTVEGAISIRLGPIGAVFRGTARIEHDETSRSGRIIGAGAEGNGRSQTQGVIGYHVLPGPCAGTTRVELEIGYALTGALAQFSRPGLVRSVAERIVSAFAANLQDRLAGKAISASARSLDPLSQLIGDLRDRIHARKWASPSDRVVPREEPAVGALHGVEPIATNARDALLFACAPLLAVLVYLVGKWIFG